LGGEVLPVQADISQQKDCQRLMDAILNRFGRVDGLVNNSGTVEPIAQVSDANLEAWQESWQINVLAPVMLSQLALPHLRQGGGRIINITSGSSLAGVGGWGAYSTAKAALNQLTRVLAAEEPSVTTLALLPGIMDTEMQSHIRATAKGRMAEKSYNWLVNLHEKGQLIPPEAPGMAIACLVLYAPKGWNGEILEWNDPRIQNLIRHKRLSKG